MNFFSIYHKMKKKIISKVIDKKINSFLFFALSTLAACNNDSKKILGLAGNAASEGLEKLFEESPSINSNYTISTFKHQMTQKVMERIVFL